MAETRSFEIYPAATLVASTWQLIIEISEGDETTSFVHLIPAAVTADHELSLLKVVFDLSVADTDTAQDVDDALFKDDIHPSEQRTETVVGNWITLAERIIARSGSGLTQREFWVEWSQPDTAKMRNDARKALITGRGWTVTAVHQHEGDDETVTTDG
jgi:hypothetical protein